MAVCKYNHQINDILLQMQKNNERFDDITKQFDEGKISKYMKNVLMYENEIEFMKLKRNEELTAEEIAKGSGLARVTARRYLEKMVEESKVEIYQEYGKIGRPTNYYKVKK